MTMQQKCGFRDNLFSTVLGMMDVKSTGLSTAAGYTKTHVASKLACIRPNGLLGSATMSRNTEHDTREHLLATGERLCMHRGFTGMGLSGC